MIDFVRDGLHFHSKPPNGFQKRGETEMPVSLTFTGRLYGETELLAVGHAYQQATGFHLRRPPMEKLLASKENGKT